VSESVLVDTGFWIALFDPREAQHEIAGRNEACLELFTLIIPWPTLYETLRTRFVRRPNWVLRFDQLLKRPNVDFVDDRQYRQEAYSLAIEYAVRLQRAISMVDMLCRLIIEDRKIRIDYLLTTNPKDFADLCRKHNVEIL